jgi:hypothetical protein
LRLRSVDICLSESTPDDYLHLSVSVPRIAVSRLRSVAGVGVAVGLRRIANAGRSDVSSLCRLQISYSGLFTGSASSHLYAKRQVR